jgi:alkylation response protein AidB-like acyl-CoA dehydrogenase
MDLELSHDEIRRGIRDYLADHDCLADVRATADAGATAADDAGPSASPPFDQEIWQGLAEGLGAAGLLVPDQYGGLGLGLGAVVGALLETGHELYPGPLRATAAATAALAATAADGGLLLPSPPAPLAVLTPQSVADALRAIALTGAVATLAVPAGGVHGGCGVTADGAGGLRGPALLHGTARAVPHGASADLLVAVADAPSGLALVLVQPDGLRRAVRRPRPGIDFSTAYADLVLDGVPGTVIAADPGRVAYVLDLAQLLTAAEQVGTAAGALDRTLDYVKLREQFGQVIGGYQALQHRCADVAVRIEAATALVDQAAAAADSGETEALARIAPLARAAASEVSLFATDTMIQLHGGIGFTWEHDAHLFFRRARATAAWFGTISQLRLEAARRDCLALIAPDPRD